jgi:hypothetical protein
MTPSAVCLQTIRHLELYSAGADGGIHRHNTPSISSSIVTVYYRFHPLCTGEFEVFTSARRSDGTITIKDPSGLRLKIPRWMTEPHAADISLCSQATLAPQSLTLLAELLQSTIADKLEKPAIPATEESREATQVTNARSTSRHRPRGSTRPEGSRRTTGLHDQSDHDGIPGSSEQRNNK